MRTDDRRRRDSAKADAARADHRDGLAGPYLQRVDDSSRAGHYRAADNRGYIRRHVVRKREHHAFLRQRVLRPSRGGMHD